MAGQANGGQVVPPRRNSMNGEQMGGSTHMLTKYGGNRNRGGNPEDMSFKGSPIPGLVGGMPPQAMPVRDNNSYGTGGSTFKPMDQGRYVGNPNHGGGKFIVPEGARGGTDSLGHPTLGMTVDTWGDFLPPHLRDIDNKRRVEEGLAPRADYGEDTIEAYNLANPNNLNVMAEKNRIESERWNRVPEMLRKDGSPIPGFSAPLDPNMKGMPGGGMSNMNGGITPLPGGSITNQMPAGFTGGGGGRGIIPWTNSVTGETWNAPSTGFTPPSSDWQQGGGQKFTNGLPRPATSSPSPGTQQPANINTLAAEGIKAAGAATGQGLSFNPQQVSVAGSSASVNPTNVVGSNVVNANVVGSNITANQIAQQNASPQVMAERLSNTDMSQYMNPYTDQVISANERDTRRAADMGLDMLGAQAQAAGGFGGSRHGIAMGEIGRGLTDTLGRQSAGLRQAGYQNAQQMAGQDITNNFQSQMANQQGGQFDINTNMAAQRANQAANLQASQQNQQNALQAALANQSAGMQSGLANQGNALQAAGMNQSYNMQGQLANQQAGQQDISNRLQAALANQSAGLSGNQQRLGAANQLGNISNLGFNMGQTVNNNLSQQGAMQQALQQAIYDNAQNKFAGYTGQPGQSIGYLGNALGVTPNVGSETLTSKKGLFDYLTLAASMRGG